MSPVIDARTLEDGRIIETGLCIVGAGAAGITLALQFVNSRVRVLLVESGGWERDDRTDALREGQLASPFPQLADSYVTQSRQRYFGGTTNTWTGWCRPLDPLDFAKRDWVPESGWPIGPDDLQQYYRGAAELLQIAPFDAVTNGAHPLDASPAIEATQFHFSPPVRFGQGALRERLIAAENITILLHGNLLELEPETGLEAVRQARLKTLTEKNLQVRARCFVLAAGAVENARLLLASNSVQPAGLCNAHDLVGRYFLEHPQIKAGVAVFAVPPASLAEYEQIAFDEKYRHDVKRAWMLSAAAQREQRLLNFCLVPYHRRHNRLSEVRELGMQVGRLALQVRRAKNEPVADTPYFMDCEIRFEQIPQPDSRVRLLEERDALGMPRVMIDYRLSDQDRDSMLGSLDWFGRELGRRRLGRLNLYLSGDDPYPEMTYLQHHQLGTARMNADPARGVVDADCRTHQLRNLYIAGGAVFPTNGHANPTMTIVALSLRLADHLRAELGA